MIPPEKCQNLINIPIFRRVPYVGVHKIGAFTYT
jgi:hypothetical protein